MNAADRQRISDAINAAHPYPESSQGGDAPAEPAPRQLAREYEGHPFALDDEARIPSQEELAAEGDGWQADEPTHEVTMLVSPPNAPAPLADRLAAASEAKRLADAYADATWRTRQAARGVLHAAIDALAGIPPEARRDASGL